MTDTSPGGGARGLLARAWRARPLPVALAVAPLAVVVTLALAVAVSVQFGVGLAGPFVGATVVVAAGGAAVARRVADSSTGEGVSLGCLARWGLVVPVLVTGAFVVLVGVARRLGLPDDPTMALVAAALGVAAVSVTTAPDRGRRQP